MNPGRERVFDLAAATGFRRATLEKVLRLGAMAADVGRHPLLRRVLMLKGGTALHLGFGAPRRLSVDIDFNYIASEDRERMLADRPDIERAVTEIAQAHGYRVQTSATAHASRKFVLGYRSVEAHADRIEVDVNFLMRVPLAPPARRNLWQPDALVVPTLLVADPVEIAAGKVCALLSRALARDAFDAAVLPGLFGPDWNGRHLRRVIIGFAGILDHPLFSYGRERFERITDEAVSEALWPMMAGTERPAARTLREAAWDAVAPLLHLDTAEREYSDSIQVGKLRPELLFPDDEEIADRLRRHPALLWKAENAKRHARGTRK